MGSVIVSILGINALMFVAIFTTTIGMLYFDLLNIKKPEKENLERIKSII